MRNKIKYIFFFLLLGFLCVSTNYAQAQDNAPTFQSLISSGDKEFAKKEYIKAKTYYQEALRLKPKDATAKSKLDNTLQKIREENRKEEQFFEYIDKADNYYADNELEKALAEYNKALKIFPKDEYATGKKNEITTILKDEKEKLDSFNEMVALGDRLLKSEKFAEAVMQYESALKLYPNNSAVKDKYQDAKNKKDAYNTKVSEFERLNTQAQEFTLRKKYAEAIAAYEQALLIFPNETELSDKIKELQTKKSIADSYDAKITEADALYEDQSYVDAKIAYEAALTVIPDDSYALGMIARVDEIVNSPEYRKIQNDKAKLDSDFAGFISKGDRAEVQKDFEAALSYYSKALELKPNNAEALSKKKNAAHSFIEVGIVLVADGTAFGVGHLCPALSTNAFEHSHDAVGGLRCGVVAELVVHVIRIRPNDGHLFYIVAKGQNAVVFQQNGRFQSHLFGQLRVFNSAHFQFS